MQSTKYFNLTQISNKEELKAAYYKLCKQYHPDHNPEVDHSVIQTINAEYEVLSHFMATEGRFEGYRSAEGEAAEIDQVFMEMYLRVADLPLKFELVGNWIWVGGDTYAYKNALKKAGYFWAAKKKAWYWRPENYKSRPSKKTLEQIKDKYGARTIESKEGRLNSAFASSS